MANRLNSQERAALKEAGTPKEIRDRILAYSNAVTRLSARQHELVMQYPKQWVAVKDDDVVCKGRTLSELVADCADKGVGLRDRDLAIRYLDTEKRIMVL